MNVSLNKKKFLIINKKNFLFFFIISCIFFLLILFYYNLTKIEYYTKKYINIFSNKFDYQLTSLEVVGLKIVNFKEIENIIKPYYNKSIFLLPLKEISNSIREKSWIKNVNIATNFKDVLHINVEEYNPIAIYSFNNNNYYINKKGKIIDFVRADIVLKNEFIIFTGNLSNIHAESLLKILKLNSLFLIENIIKANFVGERRWDLILGNGIILKLSEENPSTSIQNYFNLRKNLNNNELISIKEIDLRDFHKAIIKFK